MSAVAVTTVGWNAGQGSSGRIGSRTGRGTERRTERGTQRRPLLSTETRPAPSLRLTRRGRIVLSLVALTVAVGAALSGQTAAADSPSESVPVRTHTVLAGETLWGIAGTVAASGEDRRDVVDRLVELNGLPGAALQAGQQIIVPVR